MACELRQSCPLFNEGPAVAPTIREMYRARYCMTEFTECARYLVYLGLGRERVPVDLYPNDRLRALNLLRHGGHGHATPVT